MAVVQHGLRGGEPDQAGAVVSEGEVLAVERFHLVGEDRLAGREQVDQGGVGGEADRLVFVGLGPFGLGLAQLGAEAGADSSGS